MKLQYIYGIALGLYSCSALVAQTAPSGSGTSSVIWANASGTQGIEFTLQGKVLTDSWMSGLSGGAGPSNTLTWNATFSLGTPLTELRESFKVEDGSSSAALLIGDFKTFTESDLNDKLLMGDSKQLFGITKVDSKTFLRAAVLRFPIEKAAAKFYPVYLVNGDPENTVTVTFEPSKVFTLIYAQPVTFSAEAGRRIRVKVSARGTDEIVAFEIDPLRRGGIMAFYRQNELAQAKILFVNLHSIESLAHQAANPPKEE
jgi:hypothetical protein